MDASTAFLRDAAGKHFVCLSYRAEFSGKPIQFCVASGFVIQIETYWFLVTAGHVIRNIKEAVAAGGQVSWFTLHDQMAGNSFEHGVLLPLDLNTWVQIEDDPIQGADYAASIIPDLMVAGLKAGGVQAIEEVAWGPAPYGAYEHWLLVGIPAETHSQVASNRHVVKPTLVPLQACSPPEGVEDSIGRVCATIRPQSEGGISVTDIRGMSGGPIFGVNVVHEGGQMRYKYWLIGVQSGWWDRRRVLFFCPAAPFFKTLKMAVQEAERLVDQTPRPVE